MKRRTLIVVLSATAIVLVSGLFVGHWASAQRYGGYGPGMMWGNGFDGPGWGGRHGGWGGGPGTMWGGPDEWGRSDDFGAYRRLPAEKRTQLRELSVDTQRKMVGQQGALEELMLTYSAAIRKFPVDREAATKAWQGMDSIRKQMFDLRLESMSTAQQILGKDLWEKTQDGWGPGRGAPRGR
jgi:hypothetical protein